MTFADLGADVIKVEQPGVGDGSRWAPPYASTGEGALHLLLGRGKRSVTCDLRSDDGRAFFLDLVAGADVLVDSFRPGVLDRLGLGRDSSSAANPRLVQVALTGYGPDDGRAGHDINYVAQAGLLSLTGDGEDRWCRAPRWPTCPARCGRCRRARGAAAAGADRTRRHVRRVADRIRADHDGDPGRGLRCRRQGARCRPRVVQRWDGGVRRVPLRGRAARRGRRAGAAVLRRPLCCARRASPRGDAPGPGAPGRAARATD